LRRQREIHELLDQREVPCALDRHPSLQVRGHPFRRVHPLDLGLLLLVECYVKVPIHGNHRASIDETAADIRTEESLEMWLDREKRLLAGLKLSRVMGIGGVAEVLQSAPHRIAIEVDEYNFA